MMISNEQEYYVAKVQQLRLKVLLQNICSSMKQGQEPDALHLLCHADAVQQLDRVEQELAAYAQRLAENHPTKD
jgi:hypothetical protein